MEYEWLPDFYSHYQILGHSVAKCRWLHPEENLNTDRDNNNIKKVQGKGKYAIIQQKAQTKIWWERENPLGVGSSLDFPKPVVAFEIAVSDTRIEHPEQQASPYIIALVETDFFQTVEHPAETPLDGGNNSFHFALENVYDEIAHNSDVASIAILEPVLHVQQDNMEHPPAQQQKGVARFTATAKLPKQHPLATFIPHWCPLIIKDLEIIQQALVATNVDDEEGYTNVVSKSNRKKNKGYQTRSKGPWQLFMHILFGVL